VGVDVLGRRQRTLLDFGHEHKHENEHKHLHLHLFRLLLLRLLLIFNCSGLLLLIQQLGLLLTLITLKCTCDRTEKAWVRVRVSVASASPAGNTPRRVGPTTAHQLSLQKHRRPVSSQAKQLLQLLPHRGLRAKRGPAHAELHRPIAHRAFLRELDTMLAWMPSSVAASILWFSQHCPDRGEPGSIERFSQDRNRNI
jgi:hypothetical protein